MADVLTRQTGQGQTQQTSVTCKMKNGFPWFSQSEGALLIRHVNQWAAALQQKPHKKPRCLLLMTRERDERERDERETRERETEGCGCVSPRSRRDDGDDVLGP